jgi:hypothetical protein
MVMLYPTPTLQTYVTDLSDPVASVTYMSQCLEMEPTFMNDVISDDKHKNDHSSIFCIGNMAFTPGYGADLQMAKREAALNAITEIKNMTKKTTGNKEI